MVFAANAPRTNSFPDTLENSAGHEKGVSDHLSGVKRPPTSVAIFQFPFERAHAHHRPWQNIQAETRFSEPEAVI